MNAITNNTEKTLALANFGNANPTIAKMVERCFNVQPMDAKSFRLAVETPDDDAEPILGQYALEASVLLKLRDTAFSEIVSAANAETRKNASIPAHERGRSLSGYDDQYDGQDEPELDDNAIEDNLDQAIDRAAAICKYMDHIANIKAGGAEWLKGFRIQTWVPTQTDDEEVNIAISSKADLSAFIETNRVKRGWETVDNRLISFDEWLVTTLRSPKVTGEWRNKLAYARVMKINVDWHHVPMNDALNYVGHIVSLPAFNRTKSRLQEAVERVANAKYFNLVYAINGAVLDDHKVKALKDLEKSKVLWLALPYSEALQKDIKEVKLSDEWLDAEEQKEIEQAERESREARRAALREQNATMRMKATVEVMKLNAETNKMRLELAKQRAQLQKEMDEILNPKPAKKPSKPRTTKAKAPAKKSNTKK